MSFVAQGERPEWGCDDFWTNGTPNLEDCVAVFGTLFKLGTSSPGWFDAMFAQASTTVGSEVSFSGGFNLNDIIPSNKAYWGYKGSLVRARPHPARSCVQALAATVMHRAYPLGVGRVHLTKSA